MPRSRPSARPTAHWRPLIQKWKAGLARKDKRAESEAALAASEGSAGGAFDLEVVCDGKPDDQEMAIDMLGHIDGERPSRALAGLAILGKTDVVRRAASRPRPSKSHGCPDELDRTAARPRSSMK